MKRKISIFSCTVLIVTASAITVAQNEEAELNPQMGSRQANIDPTTGELTSQTPAESTSAARTTGVKRAPIEYITHADGTVEGDLNGWYQSNLNVTIGCDGELDTKHSEQPAEAHTRCVESE